MLSKCPESTIRKSIHQRVLSTVSSTVNTNSSPSLFPFDAIPGPIPVPQSGTASEFMNRIQKHQGDIFKAVESYYQEYGPTVRQVIRGRNEIWNFHPQSHLEILRQEGTYPRNQLTFAWTAHKYYEEKGFQKPEMLLATPEWQTWRRAAQKDMFPPAVAESYLPLLADPVKSISQQMPKVKRVSEISNYAAMDMFFSVMLGWNPHTIFGINGNPNNKASKEDLDFIRELKAAFELAFGMFRNPTLDAKNPGENWPKFVETYDRVWLQSRKYTKKMIDYYREHPTEEGVKPYLMRLLERNELSEDQVFNQLHTLLPAGVDTTHHVLLWILLHLGRYPEYQAKLRDEVFQVVGAGDLKGEHLRSLPFLAQFMRESHRVTPIVPLSIARVLPEDGHLNGYFIPKETNVLWASYPIQWDPKYVDEPTVFRPERWSAEAIQARKGTERECIDHMLCGEPFGFGPRMCIGGRLAKVELKALIARLVRDWSWEWEPKEQNYKFNNIPFSHADPYPTFRWKRI